MSSEPLTSTSGSQGEHTELFQLEALSLIYLRNQNISAIPNDIPKLNPCNICNRDILTFRFQAFVVLGCGHILHRTCLEKHIMRAGTKYPSCPSCPITVELVREESMLASGKYQIVSKASQNSDDTVVVDENDEEPLDPLGDGSRARQGSQTNQISKKDQATSPIVVESSDEDDIDENTSTQENNDTNARSSRQSTRQGSPRITREHEKFQGLLRELSTPAKGEQTETNDDEETCDSISQSLARLYQKATRAGIRVAKANQDEILCWYRYAEGCEKRVTDIRENNRRLNEQQAMSRVYKEVKEHLPGVTDASLRKKTQRARTIFRLFARIGVEKIKRVKTYSADAIASLSGTQIKDIIDTFSE